MLEQIGDWTTQLSVGKRATIYPKRPVFFLPQDGLNMPQLYNPRLDFADQFPLGNKRPNNNPFPKGQARVCRLSGSTRSSTLWLNSVPNDKVSRPLGRRTPSTLTSNSDSIDKLCRHRGKPASSRQRGGGGCGDQIALFRLAHRLWCGRSVFLVRSGK